MRPDDLLARLNDEPFRPFRVHLSDGTLLDIRNPRMVIVGPSSAVLPTEFTTTDDGEKIAKRWRTIALLHIVQFTDIVNGKKNGKHRPR